VVVGDAEIIKNGEAVKVYVEFTFQVMMIPGFRKWFKNVKEVNNEPKRMYCTPMVICEKAPFTPDVKGKWGVNPISFMKMKEVDVQQKT